jgi:hypothetical protein
MDDWSRRKLKQRTERKSGWLNWQVMTIFIDVVLQTPDSALLTSEKEKIQ